MIVFLLGKSGAGKTTVAEALEREIHDSFIIDGDDLRAETGNTNLGVDGRERNMRLGLSRARWLSDMGFTVFVAMQAPIKEIREEYKGKYDIEVVLNNIGRNEKEELGYNKNFQADYSDAEFHYDFNYDTFDVDDFMKTIFKKVVVIARFQGMHRGHKIVFETAKRITPINFIDVALRADDGDLLDVHENAQLIQNLGYNIRYSPDIDANNQTWEDFVKQYDYVVQGNPMVIRKFQGDDSKGIDKFLENVVPAGPTEIEFDNGVELIYVPRIGHISATKIRRAIKDGDDEFALKYVSKDVFDFLKHELIE